jgi:hypothetical protein
MNTSYKNIFSFKRKATINVDIFSLKTANILPLYFTSLVCLKLWKSFSKAGKALKNDLSPSQKMQMKKNKPNKITKVKVAFNYQMNGLPNMVMN